MKVILRKNAQNSLSAIIEYIENQGSPETAYKFALKMEKFSKTLAFFPDKYVVCRFPQFAKRNFRCAIFDNTYVFIYKAVKNQLHVYNIIHSKRLSAFL